MLKLKEITKKPETCCHDSMYTKQQMTHDLAVVDPSGSQDKDDVKIRKTLEKPV